MSDYSQLPEFRSPHEPSVSFNTNRQSAEATEIEQKTKALMQRIQEMSAHPEQVNVADISKLRSDTENYKKFLLTKIDLFTRVQSASIGKIITSYKDIQSTEKAFVAIEAKVKNILTQKKEEPIIQEKSWSLFSVLSSVAQRTGQLFSSFAPGLGFSRKEKRSLPLQAKEAIKPDSVIDQNPPRTFIKVKRFHKTPPKDESQPLKPTLKAKEPSDQMTDVDEKPLAAIKEPKETQVMPPNARPQTQQPLSSATSLPKVEAPQVKEPSDQMTDVDEKPKTEQLQAVRGSSVKEPLATMKASKVETPSQLSSSQVNVRFISKSTMKKHRRSIDEVQTPIKSEKVAIEPETVKKVRTAETPPVDPNKSTFEGVVFNKGYSQIDEKVKEKLTKQMVDALDNSTSLNNLYSDWEALLPKGSTASEQSSHLKHFFPLYCTALQQYKNKDQVVGKFQEMAELADLTFRTREMGLPLFQIHEMNRYITFLKKVAADAPFSMSPFCQILLNHMQQAIMKGDLLAAIEEEKHLGRFIFLRDHHPELLRKAANRNFETFTATLQRETEKILIQVREQYHPTLCKANIFLKGGVYLLHENRYSIEIAKILTNSDGTINNWLIGDVKKLLVLDKSTGKSEACDRQLSKALFSLQSNEELQRTIEEGQVPKKENGTGN
ncbi:MAG: hypothetical protein JWO53_351 [Chlamydiia bacterium]|nr:hypothetical protein [Chlamydiia bacterium]